MIKQLILLLLVAVVLHMYSVTVEGMIDIPKFDRPVKWKVTDSCSVNNALYNSFSKNLIKKTDGDDWDIVVPCGYSKVNEEIRKMVPTNDKQMFFIVNNSDEISGKNYIWNNLVKTFGRMKASTIMPKTYILTSKDDMNIFNKEYDKKKLYILKKNIQRQKGLKITSDKKEIMKGVSNKYVVVQELLQDPYLISGRKINMRMYLLLVCRNNEISAYVHRNGFIYYTQELFTKNSTENGPNITTGYIDRDVYRTNPLTHYDFRNYLDSKNRELNLAELSAVRNGTVSGVLFDRIYHMLSQCVLAVQHTVCMDSHLKNNVTFQLFGADVAISTKLHPHIMEFNKGPDMGAKDSRDKAVKQSVVDDILKILKLSEDTEHDYVQLI